MHRRGDKPRWIGGRPAGRPAAPTQYPRSDRVVYPADVTAFPCSSVHTRYSDRNGTHRRAHIHAHTRAYTCTYTYTFVHAGYQAVCVSTHTAKAGCTPCTHTLSGHVHTPVRRAFPRRRRRRAVDSLASSRGALRVCVSSVTRPPDVVPRYLFPPPRISRESPFQREPQDCCTCE